MNPTQESFGTEPERGVHFQWLAALGAGLIAAIVLMVLPRASPWSSLTFFAPVIVGRVVPEGSDITPAIAKILHLGLSMLYGIVVSLVAMHVTQLRALLAGALVGLGLYGLNYWIVSTQFQSLLGDEPTVAFTHIVFGLIAGGAYRGLLRRRPANPAAPLP